MSTTERENMALQAVVREQALHIDALEKKVFLLEKRRVYAIYGAEERLKLFNSFEEAQKEAMAREHIDNHNAPLASLASAKMCGDTDFCVMLNPVDFDRIHTAREVYFESHLVSI